MPTHFEEVKTVLPFARRCACLLLAPLLLLACARGYAQASASPATWQQKAYQGAFNRGRTIPKVDKGYLLSFRRRVVTPRQTDVIHLHSLAGGGEKSVPFWPEGASMLWLEDVALTSGNNMLVVGATLSPGQTLSSNFLATIDTFGHIVHKTSLGTWAPEMVCGSADGSAWVMGQDWQAASTRSTYPMLRHYSASGASLGSFLQRKDVHVPYLNLSARLHYAGSPQGRSYLVCSSKFVAAYIGPARTWVEVDGSGHERTWSVAMPSTISLITGLAVLDQGAVYGSFVAADAGYAHQVRGLYELKVGSSTAAWQPVSHAVAQLGVQGSPRRLLGADQTSLVFTQDKMLSFEGAPVLYWSKP